jgi:hypothetical protein
MNYIQPGYVRTGYVQQDSDTVGPFRFDGYGRFVFVDPALQDMDVSDVYSRWKEWAQVDNSGDPNLKWLPAMRYSGYDPIPGGFTGATFFMTNGWRLRYEPNATAVTGVLFSESEATAYWSQSNEPVFPVTVSAVVNQVTTTQNVVTGDVSTLPTAAEIVAAILAAAQADPIHADVKRMNAAPVFGTGQSGDAWRGAGV